MKKIICYGDSNTFGFNPEDGSRYAKNTRWTGVLSEIIGNGYQVCEEGCNNRTAFFKNEDGLLQSGNFHLPVLIDKYGAFDVFILALGTNDLQKIYSLNRQIVEEGLKNLTSIILKNNPNTRVILVTPVLLNSFVLHGAFSHQFDKSSIEASVWIQEVYQIYAEENNLEIIDLNKFVSTSQYDGLHFNPREHKIIAEKIAESVLGKVLHQV